MKIVYFLSGLISLHSLVNAQAALNQTLVDPIPTNPIPTTTTTTQPASVETTVAPPPVVVQTTKDPIVPPPASNVLTTTTTTTKAPVTLATNEPRPTNAPSNSDSNGGGMNTGLMIGKTFV